MVIPWTLVGTAAVAAFAAAAWAARRAGAAGHPRGAPVDLALALGLAALVSARLVAVAVDAALSGVLPGWRGLVTLGAGMSTPGAVAGGLLAGWWIHRRGRVPEAVWRAAAPAAAAGLAVWSLLALVRGDAAGVLAPPPLGWPLPGEAEPRVPVALYEAVAFAAFAVYAARRGAARSGPRLGAALAACAAAIHLLGSVARPTPPTADVDLDVLLGLLVLGVALLAARGAPARVIRPAVAGAGLAAAGALAVVGLATGPVERLELTDGAGAPELEGAITAEAGRGGGPPPGWGPAELGALVGAADRPVVVNFWASWCPPCHAEAPALARVARAYGDDVAFLGVLVNDDPEEAATFAERYDLPFPSVDDAGLSGALGMAGLPTTIVLRPDGTVAARLVGGLDARGLAAAIDRAGG